MALCPHCKKHVSLDLAHRDSMDSQEVHKELVGFIKKEIMYSCPHCESILGFGFFIGGLATGRP